VVRRRREEETLPHFRVRLAALLALAVLAGCTGSASTPSPSPSNSASSASPTPTLSEGQKAANDLVVKYRALIDQLRQQYKPDLTPLMDLSSDAAYEKWRYTIQEDFVNGWHQTGVAILTIRSTDPGRSAQQWLVSACLDVTKVDVVDKQGKTTLAHPGGINRVTYSVEQQPSNLKWYVTDETGGGAC
jgi:hypothetical protein